MNFAYLDSLRALALAHRPIRAQRHHHRNHGLGAARLRRRASSHLQSLFEVWHGAGCQIRRQAGHGAAHSSGTHRFWFFFSCARGRVAAALASLALLTAARAALTEARVAAAWRPRGGRVAAALASLALTAHSLAQLFCSFFFQSTSYQTVLIQSNKRKKRTDKHTHGHIKRLYTL